MLDHLGYKWFIVKALPREPKRKTRDWKIVNRESEMCLGTIGWYNHWRQYCFFPESNAAWSADCLRDVMDAMRRAKEADRVEG